MVSLAGPTPTPWPRMHSGQRNPFQNAPGLFIFALPNLAGTCPFSFSDAASSLVCPFADSAAAPAKQQQHHNECYHHPAVASCCNNQLRHPASESAESESESESLPSAGSQQSQSPLDEGHFDLGDVRSSSITEGHAGAESCATQQQRQNQQNHPERSSELSTSTRSHTLSSPIGSEFTEAKEPENEDEEEGEEEEGKEKRKRRCRKRRKRTKGRLPSEQGGCVMGPRRMGLSGLHFDRWTRYVCPAPPPFLPPPPPATMKPWFVAPSGFDGFVVPCTGAQFWDPPMAVQAVQVPGLVSVPCW